MDDLIRVTELKSQSSEYKYVCKLLQKGKIPKYVDENGYLCFKQEDLDHFRATAKRGRPIVDVNESMKRKCCQKVLYEILKVGKEVRLNDFKKTRAIQLTERQLRQIGEKFGVKIE